MDYALSHPPVLQQLADFEPNFKKTNDVSRRNLLRKTIRNRIEHVLDLADPLTTEEEYHRACSIITLAYNLVYIHHDSTHDAASLCFMELMSERAAFPSLDECGISK